MCNHVTMARAHFLAARWELRARILVFNPSRTRRALVHNEPTSQAIALFTPVASRSCLAARKVAAPR